MRRVLLLLAPILLLGLIGQGEPAAGTKAATRIHGVDAYVISDRVFVPGTQAAVRVVSKAVISLTESQPLPMARVELFLSGKGLQERRLFSGRADMLGAVEASLRVPMWPDGDYQMRIVSSSPVGKREVSETVQLRRSARILLVTDKPIYQPGQLIQLRALVLRGFDLKPVTAESIRFEVLDPKGNKVFKKELPTDDYGIAATTFQLADEIGLGEYSIAVAPVHKEAAEAAAKTVVVKKYVLPKFKVEVACEKDYYLPKQVVRGTVQADYFFGKPVAGGEVQVKASTFDASFREFASVKGQTDPQGRYKFEIRLPDYFVGQPLQKGDAVVRLEVALTDTADHVEKSVKTVPVAASPIRLTAVPEGGRLVAGVNNRIFAVTTYPDGSPASAEVVVRQGQQEVARAKTDQSGLAVVSVTPRVEDLRLGPSKPRGSFGRDRRRFGGQAQVQVQTRILDLSFSARDKQGNDFEVKKEFSTDPEGDRILLRMDKAIYHGGETLTATVLTTDADGFCYLDLIKNRQTLLSRIVPIEKGQARLRLPLGPDVFGTLELHAYKILADGEIMRDARILYVQPPNDLRVSVARDKAVYRPGGEALIRFQVTDRSGSPQAAAIGVIVVDEAVYALSELKPGLEKVYFTLEKELSKPRYQIEFGPADSLAAMVKARDLEERRQQVAQVLLAKAEPVGEPGLWQNPRTERLQKAEKDRWVFQSALRQQMAQKPLARRLPSGKLAYVKGLVAAMIESGVLPQDSRTDPLGAPYTMRVVASLWPELKAEQFLGQEEFNRLWTLRSQIYSQLHQRTRGLTDLHGQSLAKQLRAAFRQVLKTQPQMARDLTGKIYRWSWLASKPGFRQQDFAATVHSGRVQQIYYALSRYGQESGRWYRVSVLDKKANTYVLPENVLARVIKRGLLAKANSVDIWGRPFRVRKRAKARDRVYYDNRLRFYEVYSLGPDGQPNSADDLAHPFPQGDLSYQELAKDLGLEGQQGLMLLGAIGGTGRGRGGIGTGFGAGGMGMKGGGLRLERRAMAKATAAMPGNAVADVATRGPMPDQQAQLGGDAGGSGPAAPKKRQVRVREFFPETLLFQPALITDEQGRAEMKLSLADSITTWRMSASANARAGGLGGTSHGIRVFQDFFVDIDLPVALTQNDEVSIPIVVYNYLKTPQRVRLELAAGDWFELQGGRVQEIQLAPSEVSSTYYRLRVVGLGQRTLQVQADGSSMSDAIRREIEVLPDGQEQNLVANGRLQGAVGHFVDIPASAVAGASKILVRLYPGVFSQVIEGMESMLRLPGG